MLPVIVFVVLNVAFGVFGSQLAYDPKADRSWQLATEFTSGRPLYASASRSVLPSILMSAWQRVWGIGGVSAFAFKFLCFGIAFFFIKRFADYLFRDQLHTTLTLYLVAFSPYLLWSVYVGRDVALDVLGVSLVMFFAGRLYQDQSVGNVIGFAMAGAFAAMIREPNILVFLALLAFFRVSRLADVRRLVLAGGLFAVAISPWLISNYRATGTLSLSTRTGVNLLYGNHPYYLDGHPTYDIDVFMREQVEYETGIQASGLSGVEKNEAYQAVAIDAIKSDPIGFVYRSLMKAYWWIGPARIPSSDRFAQLMADQEVIVLKRQPNRAKELVYFLHRTLILVGLLLFWKHPSFSWQKSLFLLLPTLAVMPVVMLTFPDTRFRMALDPYSYVLTAAGMVVWMRELFPDWVSN